MKIASYICSGIIALFAAANVQADNIIWTNTVGGVWSDASSWNPNQVPGPTDNAFLTNDGTYTVTLDTAASVNQLTLGGGSGQQTLATAVGNNLSLSDVSEVKTNGLLQLSGGILGGPGALTLEGMLAWTAGQIGPDSVITVATNGSLSVSGIGGTGAYLEFSGIVTNYGTFTITNTGVRCIDYAGYGGGYGLLVNAPGGLLDLQTGSFMLYYNDSSGLGAPAVFNYGTMRKSAGTDTTSIDLPLYNGGILDVQSGTVSLDSGGNGAGVYQAEAGATLLYPTDYEVDGTISGSGTNLLTGGVFTLKGSIAGQFLWTAGQLGINTAGSISPTGQMQVNPLGIGLTYLDFSGILTNYGTIHISNGGIRCIDYNGYGGGYGLLVNAPGGLIDLQAGSIIEFYNDGSGAGTPVVVNQGIMQKSQGGDISPIKTPFYNSGTLDVQAGTVSVNGGGSGNGIFLSESGATLDFESDYEVDSALTGAGTNTFTTGSFTLNGTLSTSNAFLQGGLLAGTTGIIADRLNWSSGRLDAGGVLTVATNGQVVVNPSDSVLYVDLAGVLTNYGRMVVTNGGLRCMDYNGYPGGYGLLVNAAGGLIDLQSNAFVEIYNDYSGIGTPTIINNGTIRKSNGTDTSYINVPLYNLGTLDAQTGVINLTSSYDLTGGRLNFGLSSLANFGQINLTGDAVLTGTLSVNLKNGYVPIRSNVFPVLTYGSQTGSFTNFVLPNRDAWSSNYDVSTFSLTVLNSAPRLPAQTNQVVDEETTLTVNNTATDLDLPPDTLTYSFLSAPTGAAISPSGIITWTPTEAQGPSTNIITTRVVDSGTPSLSATNTFTVVVNEINVAPVLPVQSDLAINEQTTLMVTNTATDHDLPVNPLTYALQTAPTGAQIDASGIITWTPTEAQGPSTNVFTTVVTDTNQFAVNSKSLSATNTFTVVVNEVNTAPVLTVPANASVNELTPYAATATATDSDIPANPLTFALVSGPTGLTVSPSGSISWTPTEAQGPSTNTVTISVTDTNQFAINSKSLSVTNSFQIIVNEVNSTPVLTVPANASVNELTAYSATATATDADLPANPLTFALVSGPTGLTVSPGGSISWTPTEAQGPSTNTVTISVTDTNQFAVNSKSLSVTNSFQIIVNEVNTAPTLGALADRTVNPGQTITFTATATDTDLPTNTLTFSLISPPAGAAVDGPSGVFNWRTTISQAGTTNLVQMQVTDFNPDAVNAQHLTDTKTFKVIVNPLAPVILTSVTNTGSQIKFQVNGTTGPDYIIQVSTNLLGWSDLSTNLAPATPFQFTNPLSATNRFYRVRLSP